MKLTEILSVKEWEQFEKELSDRFGINCSVYDSSGTGLTGKSNWCNDLCPKIKGNENSLAAICAVGNNYFMSQAEQTGQPVIGECDAGLVKIAVPIFNAGKFLGTAGGCGLLPEGGELEIFLIQKTTGMNEREIADLCQNIGTMTTDRAERMVEAIQNRFSEIF